MTNKWLGSHCENYSLLSSMAMKWSSILIFLGSLRTALTNVWTRHEFVGFVFATLLAQTDRATHYALTLASLKRKLEDLVGCPHNKALQAKQNNRAPRGFLLGS